MSILKIGELGGIGGVGGGATGKLVSGGGATSSSVIKRGLGFCFGSIAGWLVISEQVLGNYFC